MDIVNETVCSDTAGKPIIIIDDHTPYLGRNANTPFYHNGIKYKTFAHFCECQKALLMESYDTFHAANRARSPARATTSALGMTVDDEKWYRTAEEKLLEGLTSKFSQNYGALSALKSTKGQKIIYADAKDGYLGTGLSKTNPANGDETSWPGKNKLGHLMCKVRSNLA